MIKLEFYDQGLLIPDKPQDFKVLTLLQQIHIQNNLDFVSTLLEQKEVVVKIEISKIDDEFLWEKFVNDPSLLDILNEVKRLKEASLRLERLSCDLVYLNYDQRFEIERKGREAIEIALNLKSFSHFIDIEKHIKSYTFHLNHTMNKEVKMLISYPANSQKRKTEVVKDAVNHLTSDINNLVRLLNNPR